MIKKPKPKILNRGFSLLTFTCFALMCLIITSCQNEFMTPSPDSKVASPNITSTSSLNSASIIAPATNGVMMQGFYWNVPGPTSPSSDWWTNLSSKATEFKNAGITAIWLPPAYKGGSGFDVGYGVYDRYDLGEFNQKGTVATLYGLKSNLTAAVTALHNNNIAVYEDMVMNHLMNADATETFSTWSGSQTLWTKFNYSGRNNTYSSYQWNYTLFNGTQQAPNNGWYQWNNWDFQPYDNGDAYDNLMGCEIRYNDGNGNPTTSAATETINWGNWITGQLSLDGYRIDAGKHIFTNFLNSWFDNVKGSRFAVSEVWFNSVPELQSYISSTGGRTSLFDVPLHYLFNAMSNGNGTWDMRGLQFAGLTEADGAHSVSFVENHDTDVSGGLYSPVINLKMLAYAYILTRSNGYPCVFYKDYYNYGLGAQIKTLIGVRQANGYGSGYEYTSVNDADVYVYSRSGDATHPGMLVMLNDGNANSTKTITTPFKNVTLTDKTGNTPGTVTTDANGVGNFTVYSRNYAVWVPTTLNNTKVTFNINYSGTVYGQDLYVVGNTPQLGNWTPLAANKLSGANFPNWNISLNLLTGSAIQYKYLISTAANLNNPSAWIWEPGSNKNLTPTGSTQTVNDTW